MKSENKKISKSLEILRAMNFKLFVAELQFILNN